MASHPPGQCCVEKHIHEGTPIGEYKPVFDLDTYSVGDNNDKIVVIITDIYGNKLVNTQLIADEISRNGFKVLIPDILQGDPIGTQDLQQWIKKHGPELTSNIVDGFLKKVRQELKPKFLFGLGHCFGGKYTIQNLSENGLLDAGAVAHPSFVDIEEVKQIKKPLLISAAETDPIFPIELRHQTEVELIKTGARYQIDLFSGVSHGFAVKGDITNPVVKYAKEKALTDQICWFHEFSK